MIHDLQADPAMTIPAADVVVIGAGIAGLIAATRLAERGLKVVVLESGGLRQETETHPLNTTEQVGQYYNGADHGRFRCIGGTSTRWGGALIPFARADTELHPSGWDADWHGVADDLAPYVEPVEALFGLPQSSYDDAENPPLGGAGLVGGGAVAFHPRLAKWPSFSNRNVAHLLAEKIAANDGPSVILNATAARFVFAPDGRLSAVDAALTDGAHIRCEARHFIFAAGAIETTRLLLLADRAANGRIFAPHDVLGRYFHDHIGSAAGEFDPSGRTAMNKIAGFRFEGRGMRNLRFEPSRELRAAHGLPAGFAHIAFESEGDSPFGRLREILRAIQRRERLPLAHMAGLIGSSGWMARMIWWRLARRRLLYPDDASLILNIVTEQQPTRESRIDLSTKHDRHGLPIARIDWRVSGADIANIQRMTELFAAAWQASPMGSKCGLTLYGRATRDEAVLDSGGVYHPGGSTRIGARASDGVVDRDLRVFGIANATVAATSVFPTAGGSNPTMMLAMATLRAVDRISRELTS